MIRVCYWQGERVKTLSAADFSSLQQLQAKWVWVDFNEASSAQIRTVLDGVSGLGVTVSDHFLDHEINPRIEMHGEDTAVWSVRGLDARTETIDFGVIQLAFLWFGNILFTRHQVFSPSIDLRWTALMEGQGKVPASALEVGLVVCQTVFDRYVPIVRRLEARLDVIEDELLATSNDKLLIELTEYKTRLRKIRRNTTYHLQVFSVLAEGLPNKKPRALHGVRDTLDRIMNLSLTFHDMCGDLIDGYISLSSHRMNQIMKVLTMITAVFVPLGFLAGIYGMNFENMPELGMPNGYFVLLSAMACLAAGILLVFRIRRWF